MIHLKSGHRRFIVLDKFLEYYRKLKTCVHTNMSPMCEQHMILWLQHVAATCPCLMTPRVREA